MSVFLFMPLAYGGAEYDTKEEKNSNKAIKNALRAHIEFLADDLLKGRATGSVEYEIAAKYVASHFKQFGLKPGGNNNSWFQSVPIIKSTLIESEAQFILHSANSSTEFSYPQQFLSGASAISVKDEVTAELVFIGYGIVSKELDHDDYAGLDVKGKIVVILAGNPATLPSEEAAHLSSGAEKARHAAEHGAVAMITLHTPQRNEVLSYERILSHTGSASFRWKNKEGGVFGNHIGLKGSAYLPIETGIKIFDAAGYNLNKIFALLENDVVPAGFAMDMTVTLKRKSSQEQIRSSNIIGILEGSDPTLKNEYVVYSGHLDHLGIGGDGEDNINNGALDNASGIAIMLETARRFSQGERPKRSIMFIAVTGEEKGLLGSNYFAHYPTVPVSSMVAVINLDMPVILYPFADVIAFGAQHSTLAGFVKAAAAKHKVKLSPDPMPEQAVFVRSDHYSFVKQGVPSIFLVTGFESKNPEINGNEFFSKHYHQPSDDISLPIDYEAGLTFTKINFTIGQSIANSPLRPRWNEGNYFGRAFSKVGKKEH